MYLPIVRPLLRRHVVQLYEGVRERPARLGFIGAQLVCPPFKEETERVGTQLFDTVPFDGQRRGAQQVEHDVRVGYGEQSREQTGGAVQSVTDEDVRDVKTARVEELLAGRFPGVYVIRTPSGGWSLRIRGVSTLRGSGEPLYVVDGLPVRLDPGHGLDWLNPADIERIDVLKNPAETSMYGVRGANGVILITTKSGQ